MTRSEVQAVLDEVFEELLPKIKDGRRREFGAMLVAELQDRGLDIEEDEPEDSDLDL